MSLSREEFWVLDAAAQVNCPIQVSFLNSPNADEIFNKSRHHGLSTDELAGLLAMLQHRGDIVVFPYRENLFPEFETRKDYPSKAPGLRIVFDPADIWRNAVSLSKAEILGRLTEIERLFESGGEHGVRLQKHLDVMLLYCLTPQGAEKWERTAQVDWNKYLDCAGSWDWEDTDLSEQQSIMLWRAAALRRETLDAYFDWKIRWDNKLYSWETSSFRRYHTERISPWRATYWKTFPEGFECDYLELTLHREEGLTCEEHAVSVQQSAGQWPEHHALFDWCNAYVRDFPFEGD